MTTPKRNEIYDKAVELWKKDQFRKGSQELSQLNPEYSELLESGYFSVAQSMLMRNEREYEDHIEREYGEIVLRKKSMETETVQGLLFDLDEALRSGIFISGTSGSGKTNLAKLIAKTLIKNGITVFTLDPSQSWLELEGLMRVLRIREPKGREQISWNLESTIFDISLLTVTWQRKFCEIFCRSTFQTYVRSAYRPRTFVFFEEAQLYLPLNGLRSNVAQEIMRLVSSGRNYNLRFGLITQFASMVDKLPVKMAKQRYFGYTDELNDKKYIANFIGWDRVRELEMLKTGQFLYDFGPETKRIKVPLFEPKAKQKCFEYV